MILSNRTYVVFDLTEVDNLDFREVAETSRQTLRNNLANTQSFVKYQGDMPPSIAALNTRSKPYTHTEMLGLLDSAQWTDLNYKDE